MLLTLALSLSACATAANRRALYFPAKPGGLWHDYEARRLAEAQTGVNTSAYTSAPSARTPLPPSGPVPSSTGTDLGAPPPNVQSVNPAPPAPDAGLPQTPATPGTGSAADPAVPVAPPQ